MPKLLRTAALLLCCMMAGATTSAHELNAQTRADSAAVLLNAAEQLRLRGETDAARAVLELIARQYAGTPAAGEIARMQALLQRTPQPERSGRTELLVFGATYGAWLGIAAPIALDASRAEAYGVGLLLGAPVGFYAAKRYADAKMPTEGQTRALTFGGLWGTLHGFALAEVLDLGVDDECFPTGECFPDGGVDGSTYVTAAVAGGLLGIGTGAFLARKPITAGTAAAVTLAGMWGAWYGFGLTFVADQDSDELLTASMIGGNAALIAMGIVAPKWQMSESRARLISVSGIAGGLAGAGLLLIAQPGGEEAGMLFPLIGSASGLVVGALLTRDRDRAAPGRGDGGGGGAGASGGLDALLTGSGGHWTLDVPAAALRMQRAAQGGLRPAVYVPLLSARF